MRTIGILLIFLGIVVGGTMYYAGYLTADPPTVFRTTPIVRGDLTSAISATGTVVAEEFVDVGAQVVGRVKSFGVDPRDPKKTIDYGSIVHEGTVLAIIDDAVYKAQVDQAQASLQRAQADLLQLQARCEQTEQEWKRAEALRPTKAIADTDYDLTLSNYKAAKANVSVGEAAINQARAALELAKTNLNYTVIKSPIEGVIVARRVNIGQTVVASLNAPSLFLIAKDLRRIQVWASVNEADIGRIHVDMPVSFTVDAYPGEVFRGKVSQIRLNAAIAQNVVTYTVVVVTENPDGKLFPYMTANLQFEIHHRSKVLQVANAALRWKPLPEQIAPDARETEAVAGTRNEPPDSQPSERTSKLPAEQVSTGRLWVAFEGFVRPLTVRVGVSDGSMTEVSGRGVEEGMKVVMGVGRPEDRDAGAGVSSPFLPKIRGGQRSKQP